MQKYLMKKANAHVVLSHILINSEVITNMPMVFKLGSGTSSSRRTAMPKFVIGTGSVDRCANLGTITRNDR